MRIKNFYGAKKIFFALGFIFLTFFSASLALAQSGNYVPLVPIPGVTGATGLLGYLSGLYNFLISVVGILAMAVIVYGGLRYLTSVGNPSAVESAKETIMSAIYGLILALVSWMILNTINPDTLLLKKPGVSGPSSTYSTAISTNSCIASPTGAGTIASPCKCVDNPTIPVTFTQVPYVVSSSIKPCTIGVTVSTSSITVTFSEPMDPATIIAANIVLSALPPITVALNPLDSKQVIVTITAPLQANQDYTLVFTTGVKSAGGVSIKGPSWDLRFTTKVAGFAVPCVPPSMGATSCQAACSDSTTPGLTPAGYHCLKADLRVGNALSPIGKEVTVKVNESIFIDAKTFSFDGSYPGLKTDVPISNPAFDNGIDRYEMCYNADSWIACNPLWTSYGCSEPTGTCGVLNWLGSGVVAFWGQCGLDSTSFSSSGKYKAVLWAISKKDCTVSASDEVIINVNP